MKKTIVFILSSSYSGSHYLSLLLGSHSKTKHMGELRKLSKSKSDRAKGREVFLADDPIFDGIGPDNINSIFDVIFERLDDQTEVIIDASKSHEKWARLFVSLDKFDKRYIHLIRDPRAMLRRWAMRTHFRKNLRTKRRLLAYNKSWKKELFWYNQNKILNHRWVMENELIHQFLEEHSLDYQLVTYHDLAKHPEREISRLMDWLNVPFEKEQLEYWNFNHIGTQKKAYADVTSKDKCAIDLRWQEDLDEADLASVVECSGTHSLISQLRLSMEPDGLSRLSEDD